MDDFVLSLASIIEYKGQPVLMYKVLGDERWHSLEL